MKKAKVYLILINLVLLLVYINYAIVAKERILGKGELILIKLAPVDPRSLMQGDYMILNYDLSSDLAQKSGRRGYCVVQVDKNHIARVVRLQSSNSPLNPGEKLIKYTSPHEGDINIGAESFFFEEGQGEKFEAAAYGAIKIDQAGNSLLVGLYNKDLKKIE